MSSAEAIEVKVSASGASPKFHSDALQTLFFAKMIPYCLFTLTFLREIPTEPLQFPSRTKEFKTRFWLLKNSVVTVTLVMEGYFENFCNVAVHSAAESFSYAKNGTV